MLDHSVGICSTSVDTVSFPKTVVTNVYPSQHCMFLSTSDVICHSPLSHSGGGTNVYTIVFLICISLISNEVGPFSCAFGYLDVSFCEVDVKTLCSVSY